MTPLYLAPLNKLNNSVYRHMLLSNGADYAFTELIFTEYLFDDLQLEKLDVFEEDLPKTIFQIAASTTEEIKKGIDKLFQKVKPVEVNLNMGCPNSRMKKKKICGGILYDKEHMKNLCEQLFKESKLHNFVPSVKLRMGTAEHKIEIDAFLNVIQGAGIKKVYVHGRTLKHGYSRPANYVPLKEIKKQFPDLTIVLNGDVFSYESYKLLNEFPNDGVMIGRAALYNPLIFQQIKNKIPGRKGGFEPCSLDPYIVQKASKFYPSEEKKEFILNYLELAKKHDLHLQYVRNNLSYVLRGLSGYKKIKKQINEATEINAIEVALLFFLES